MDLTNVEGLRLDSPKGVYWRGADGKVYVSGSGGTNAAGMWDPNTQNYWTSRGYELVADPLGGGGGQTQGTSTYSRTATGGGGTVVPELNQAAIDNTQKAIGSLDTELAVGNKSIDDSFGSLIGGYDREAQRAETDYSDQTVTNNQNFAKNKQNALLAAAQGRRGLRGTLASIGALSGYGGRLADRAVTQGANADIGGAAETSATNALGLDRAIGNFREEDKNRRADAETARTNQRTAQEGRILSKRQQFFQKMAELFGEGGRTAEATDYLNRAGDLNTPIAQKSAVAATPFSARAAAFTPGKLADYLAGAGDMTVEVAPGGINRGGPTTILAGRGRRKDEELLPA